jgi:putative copper export protein
MNPLFQILHGSQFLLTCWLVGYFFFHNWIARPVGSARQATPETNLRGCRLLLGSLLTISILWFLCVTFEMAESLGPADIWMAIQSTSFGHISCFQISLLLILLFFSYTQFFSRAGWLVFLLPFSLSLSGHAGADPSHLLLNLTLDTIHVVSVSIWTGGLVTYFYAIIFLTQNTEMELAIWLFNAFLNLPCSVPF